MHQRRQRLRIYLQIKTMKFRQRQVIHLSMEKEDVIYMSYLKDQLGLNGFADVQRWLLKKEKERREGRFGGECQR